MGQPNLLEGEKMTPTQGEDSSEGKPSGSGRFGRSGLRVPGASLPGRLRLEGRSSGV